MKKLAARAVGVDSSAVCDSASLVNCELQASEQPSGYEEMIDQLRHGEFAQVQTSNASIRCTSLLELLRSYCYNARTIVSSFLCSCLLLLPSGSHH